jgi:hypothetical protein
VNTMRFIWMPLVTVLLAPAAHAQIATGNGLTLSARLGFNISTRFKGNASGLPTFAPNRLTPQGDTYNYDDGYVLTDSSGNYGGQTWYWGYDNSASYPGGQISDGINFPDNTVLLSRSTADGSFASPSTGEDLIPGFELTYSRRLGQMGNGNWGVEIAANWQSLSTKDSSTFYGNAMRVTDAFPFAPGTTPPTATSTPNNPYQGAYGDEGFLLGDTPINSTTSLVPGGATISGQRRFEADLWGFRLGPYLNFPLTEKLNLSISGGLAVGLLDSQASWSDTVTVSGKSVLSTGSGNDFGILLGGVAAANLSWDFNDRWSATAGVQYQYLGTYEADFGKRSVEVDLSKSFFLQLGATYRF